MPLAEKRKDGSGDGDEHWPKPQDSCIDKRQLQFFANLSALLDELKQDNDVADNDADQADDAEECHKAERLSHDGQGANGSRHSIGDCGKDDQWFDGVFELRKQREIDTSHADNEYNHKIAEPAYLRLLFSGVAKDKALWQLRLKFLKLRQSSRDDFRRKMTFSRPALDGDAHVLIEATDLR